MHVTDSGDDGVDVDSVTDSDSLDDVVKKVNEVLQNGDNGQVPTIADEVLPEYYNVIDGCTQPGKPVLVDSLPNWKYPDFAATKNCGKNFQPYVGEKQYLWDGGSTFKCGDPKIMDDTGCGTGLKENFELNCEDAPQGAKRSACCISFACEADVCSRSSSLAKSSRRAVSIPFASKHPTS